MSHVSSSLAKGRLPCRLPARYLTGGAASMSSVELLPGILQKKTHTKRLEMAYLVAGEGEIPIVLVHGNCSSSHFFQDFMLALTTNKSYTVYAPDMRGYGDSETLPVDATRGVRDYSDDLASFI